MNANELADEIQQISNITTHLSDKVVFAGASRKLRQQQEEIEYLKTMLQHYEDVYEGVATHPVKEISLSGNSAEILSKNDETLPNGKLELTDEEIFSIAIDCTYGGDLHADKFARAILRKAQEK